jgi:general secretion pathway protein G
MANCCQVSASGALARSRAAISTGEWSRACACWRGVNSAHRCYPSSAITVVLYALLAGGCSVAVVVPLAFIDGFTCPKSDFARLDVGNLKGATKIFVSQRGRLPLGADELVSAQILDKSPMDPWGHPYRYWVVLGQPAFVSLGADGACGGEGEDADIGPPEPRPGECEWRDR